MYIYVTGSTERIETNKQFFQDVLYLIKKYGYQNSNDYLNSLLEGTPNPDNNKNNFHSKTRKRIKKAVLLLADISNPSITLGTLIEYAISDNIPVLCICESTYERDLPSILKYYDSRLFTLIVYDKNTLKDELEKYLENFRRNKVKFNVFISSDLDNYMKWYSKRNSISKSDLFRDIVTKKMEEDKEYQKLLPTSE